MNLQRTSFSVRELDTIQYQRFHDEVAHDADHVPSAVEARAARSGSPAGPTRRQARRDA